MRDHESIANDFVTFTHELNNTKFHMLLYNRENQVQVLTPLSYCLREYMIDNIISRENVLVLAIRVLKLAINS